MDLGNIDYCLDPGPRPVFITVWALDPIGWILDLGSIHYYLDSESGKNRSLSGPWTLTVFVAVLTPRPGQYSLPQVRTCGSIYYFLGPGLGQKLLFFVP